MSEQQNVEFMKQPYVAFNGGNIEALLEMFADDAEWVGVSVNRGCPTRRVTQR